jgi:DNA-binding NtrC family response regulator
MTSQSPSINLFDELSKLTLKAGMSRDEVLTELDKCLIRAHLKDVKWNQCKAARTLRIHRNTLSRLILELGMLQELKLLRSQEREKKPISIRRD